MMKRTGPLLVWKTHVHGEEELERLNPEPKKEEEIEANDDYNIAESFKCMSLHRQDSSSSKRGEKKSIEKYGNWRQEQRIRTARMEKQLKATIALEGLIEEHLKRFASPSNRSPSRLEDVSELLMPKWMPPMEMASLIWFGDWRPSAILQLLRSLSRSLYTSCFSDPRSNERVLSQFIHETRIEETVIDEEMAEIQINCILHLPFFGPEAMNRVAVLAAVQSDFKKIDRVITKAQQLRYKALEMSVTKLLNQTDAAQFLVALAGIQDAIHQFAANQRLQKGPVSVTIKAMEK